MTPMLKGKLWHGLLPLISATLLALILSMAGCSEGGAVQTSAIKQAQPTLAQGLDLIELLLNDQAATTTYKTLSTSAANIKVTLR